MLMIAHKKYIKCLSRLQINVKSLQDLKYEERWFAISVSSPKFASNFRNEICKLPVEFQ